MSFGTNQAAVWHGARQGDPFFSIVIPTYHRPQLLRRALESVLKQEGAPFQVIVVDDGPSTAASLLVTDLQDPRLLYVAHERNKGVSAARNTGTREAAGEWIVFLDDDDELLPGGLASIQTRLASRNPRLDFTWGGVERWRDGEPLDAKCWNSPADRFAYLGAGSGFALTVRKSALLELGGFDESLRACVDFELMIRLGRAYVGAPTPGLAVRVHLHHGGQLTDPTPARAYSLYHVAVKHEEFLSSSPQIGPPFLRKAARICYLTGLHELGWELLARALISQPLDWRVWKSLVFLGILGTEEPDFYRISQTVPQRLRSVIRW